MVEGKVGMHAREVTINERFIYPSGDSEVQVLFNSGRSASLIISLLGIKEAPLTLL